LDERGKLRIVEESFAGWRQASATARRHGISISLLFAWRKAARWSMRRRAASCRRLVVEERPAATPPAPSRIEIVTPNGYRVLVDAGVAAAALARVLAVLARA
jgi:transposase